jgi:hypothetical protein
VSFGVVCARVLSASRRRDAHDRIGDQASTGGAEPRRPLSWLQSSASSAGGRPRPRSCSRLVGERKPGTRCGARTSSGRCGRLAPDGGGELVRRWRSASTWRLRPASGRSNARSLSLRVGAESLGPRRPSMPSPSSKRPPDQTARRALLVRWRRRELNPGPRSCGCGVYERSRRSSSRPRLASPAGLSGASSLDVPGAEGANPLRASLLIDPGSPPQARDGRDEPQLPTKQPRIRDRNCASPHLFSSGCFTRPPGTSARNHPHEPTTSKPVVPWGYWCLRSF